MLPPASEPKVTGEDIVKLALFPGAEKGEGKKERLVSTVRACTLIFGKPYH